MATVQFEDAAKTQSAALGLDAAKVLTEHPIQDRTDDEMRAIADSAIEELIAALADGDGYIVGGRAAELRGEGGTHRTPMS